jgi:hypothetical protein
MLSAEEASCPRARNEVEVIEGNACRDGRDRQTKQTYTRIRAKYGGDWPAKLALVPSSLHFGFLIDWLRAFI